MKALSSPQHKSRRHLGRALVLVFSSSLGGVALVALGLGLLLAISVPQPRPAQAVGLNGVITNTTVADFQTCGM